LREKKPFWKARTQPYTLKLEPFDRPTEALKLFKETLALKKAKLGPDHSNTLFTMLWLANTYAALGRLPDALKLSEETVALMKAKLGPNYPITLYSMGELANIYFAMGRLKELEQLYKDFEQQCQKGIERDPSDHWNWYCEAPLCLQRGDIRGYCRVCREMLARFSQTDDPAIAERTAKTCLLRPGAVSDIRPVRQLADRAITGTEQHKFYRYFLLTKAMADYRAGDFLNAIARVNKSLSMGHDARYSGSRNPCVPGTAYSLLAMAHHQLGHAIEARQALDQATQLMGPKYGVTDWLNWLGFRLVYREAEELLRSKPEALK
jgi:tetratricopeptide (TPR) repeat protein